MIGFQMKGFSAIETYCIIKHKTIDK